MHLSLDLPASTSTGQGLTNSTNRTQLAAGGPADGTTGGARPQLQLPAPPLPQHRWQTLHRSLRFGPRWVWVFWGVDEKGRVVRSPGMTVTPGPMIARIPDGTSTSVPSTIRSTSPTVCWPRADPAITIARINTMIQFRRKSSFSVPKQQHKNNLRKTIVPSSWHRLLVVL